MTAPECLVVDEPTADALDLKAATYVAHWRALLTLRGDVTPSPLSVLWAIEDAVRMSPGLGLTFTACEGPCGRCVWGADDEGLLILCPACEDDASQASEEFLLSLYGRDARSVQSWPDTIRQDLADRIAAEVEEDLYDGHRAGLRPYLRERSA